MIGYQSQIAWQVHLPPRVIIYIHRLNFINLPIDDLNSYSLSSFLINCRSDNGEGTSIYLLITQCHFII